MVAIPPPPPPFPPPPPPKCGPVISTTPNSHRKLLLTCWGLAVIAVLLVGMLVVTMWRRGHSDTQQVAKRLGISNTRFTESKFTRNQPARTVVFEEPTEKTQTHEISPVKAAVEIVEPDRELSKVEAPVNSTPKLDVVSPRQTASVVKASEPPAAEFETEQPVATSQGSAAPVTCSIDSPENMAAHGTALHWANSPGEAVSLARQQSKLVFMIHVSGNFAIPEFT